MKNIVEVASEAGTFNTLLKAAREAGLEDTLSKSGPFTVFAPNDEAFAKLPSGTVEGLLRDREKLSAILKYHLVSGRMDSNAVTKQDRLRTVQGKELPVDLSHGVRVGSAKVIKTDIDASNGVIHVIDTVQIP